MADPAPLVAAAAWWAPWVPVVSGAVGGLTALAGQGLTHFLTSRRENTRRKEESEAKALADLKDAYVVYLAELQKKAGALLTLLSENASKSVMRETLSRLLLLDPSDAYFRVRMLERPEHRSRIEKAGKADLDLIAMAVGDACSSGELAAYLNNALIETNKFQEWVYTKRFASSDAPQKTK